MKKTYLGAIVLFLLMSNNLVLGNFQGKIERLDIGGPSSIYIQNDLPKEYHIKSFEVEVSYSTVLSSGKISRLSNKQLSKISFEIEYYDMRRFKRVTGEKRSAPDVVKSVGAIDATQYSGPSLIIRLSIDPQTKELDAELIEGPAKLDEPDQGQPIESE